MEKRLFLSENEVKEIVAGYLMKDGYIVTKDQIKTSIETSIEGYGMGEHKVVRFHGFYIEVD